MKTVLYFGSFNPVHRGHVEIAEYLIREDLCDQLIFVVSPQNPLKPIAELADDNDRKQMLEMAVSESVHSNKMQVWDIEFELPKPSYTIQTLEYLKKEYPKYQFSILIGSDNLLIFDQWRDYQRILDNYELIVYPREGSCEKTRFDSQVTYLTDAPLMKFSSTDVRDAITRGDDIDRMTFVSVINFMCSKNLYKITDCKGERYWNSALSNYAGGHFAEAYNDFIKAAELLPTKKEEIVHYVKLIKNIFAFRYKDMYNP